jgi:hypothetical protein
MGTTISITVNAVFVNHYLHAQTRNTWVAWSGSVSVKQEVFSNSIVRMRSVTLPPPPPQSTLATSRGAPIIHVLERTEPTTCVTRLYVKTFWKMLTFNGQESCLSKQARICTGTCSVTILPWSPVFYHLPFWMAPVMSELSGVNVLCGWSLCSMCLRLAGEIISDTNSTWMHTILGVSPRGDSHPRRETHCVFMWSIRFGFLVTTKIGMCRHILSAPPSRYRISWKSVKVPSNFYMQTDSRRHDEANRLNFITFGCENDQKRN